MLVRVLGAIELVAADGGTVALPGTRQPALLAALPPAQERWSAQTV